MYEIYFLNFSTDWLGSDTWQCNTLFDIQCKSFGLFYLWLSVESLNDIMKWVLLWAFQACSTNGLYQTDKFSCHMNIYNDSIWIRQSCTVYKSGRAVQVEIHSCTNPWLHVYYITSWRDIVQLIAEIYKKVVCVQENVEFVFCITPHKTCIVSTKSRVHSLQWWRSHFKVTDHSAH